jgi:hypothetical protein
MNARLPKTSMRAHVFFWPAVVAALGLAGCAPVDEPAPAPAAAPATLPAPAPLTEAIGAPKEAAAPAGLEGRVEAALRQVRARDLLTTNSFWTVFHGILGVGPGATLLDPVTGKRVNAIEYIRNGGEVRGMEFIPTRDGLEVRIGPQFVGQGHPDQFVAELTEWGVTPPTKFLVHGKEYTFMDFIRQAQARTRLTPGSELTWTIVVVGTHLGTGCHWKNAAGEDIHFEDVVRHELDEPVDSAACGGTHRLFGLTWAYYLHLRHGGKKEGVWNDVPVKLAEYEEKARRFQNPDGMFSTRYLAGPGNARDPQLRIGTTGHVLEWLALALTDEQLREPWVRDAANALSLAILDNGGSPVESGALYHAAHGLRIYHDRVFGSPESTGTMSVIPLPP